VNTVLHWFRRDFRAFDNTGLLGAADAAGRDGRVAGVFIIDPRWWDARKGKLGAHQAEFWLASVAELQRTLAPRHIQLIIRTSSDPVAAVIAAAEEIGAGIVTYNKEYEPAQIEMDDRLERTAGARGLAVKRYKDAAIFEEQEIRTGAGGIYSVFTAYKNAYLKRLFGELPELLPLPQRMAHPTAARTEALPTLQALGFESPNLDVRPGEKAAATLLERFISHGITSYAETRDTPALSLDPKSPGTSRLSAHLSAGTLSIRQAMHAALAARARQKPDSNARASCDTFVAELIWREFYRMILYNFPQVVSAPFNENYRRIRWANNPDHLAAWQNSETGYPIVDAAMMQLRQTGFMHNRLRMIAAMFLSKDLDVHWMEGERFFMRSLMDYDQASNVGGWQWSASTGTDAAPYFRIMNPVLQSEKFDPEGRFIRHFLPALRLVPREYVHAPWKMPPEVQRAANCRIGTDYPAPIVDHAEAKARSIAKFKA
jgi:deoxyribodipyrimidine photo-lyase